MHDGRAAPMDLDRESAGISAVSVIEADIEAVSRREQAGGNGTGSQAGQRSGAPGGAGSAAQDLWGGEAGKGAGADTGAIHGAISGQQRIAGLGCRPGQKLDGIARSGVVNGRLLQHAIAVNRKTGGRGGHSGKREHTIGTIDDSGRQIAIHKTGRANSAGTRRPVHVYAIASIAGRRFHQTGAIHHGGAAHAESRPFEGTSGEIADQSGDIRFRNRTWLSIVDRLSGNIGASLSRQCGRRAREAASRWQARTMSPEIARGRRCCT